MLLLSITLRCMRSSMKTLDLKVRSIIPLDLQINDAMSILTKAMNRLLKRLGDLEVSVTKKAEPGLPDGECVHLSVGLTEPENPWAAIPNDASNPPSMKRR